MILSIDGGATKTCAMLFDEKERSFVSSGIAGPSHFASVPPETSVKNIGSAISDAMQRGSVSMEKIDHVILGVAGVGDSIETTRKGEEIVRKVLSKKEFALNNDGYVAYRMSNLFEDGVLFAPGTGSVGFYQKNGNIRRIAGWGWFAGDEGSASWIAKRALTLAQRQMDGILGGDSLVRLVEEYFGDNFSEVIGKLEREHDKRKVSMLSPYVSRLASNGDPLALSIIEEAGRYVGSALNSCLRNFEGCPSVSVVGGVVRSGDAFREAIESTARCMPTFFMGFHVCVGGIVITTHELGITISREERDTIISQLEEDIMSRPRMELQKLLGFV